VSVALPTVEPHRRREEHRSLEWSRLSAAAVVAAAVLFGGSVAAAHVAAGHGAAAPATAFGGTTAVAVPHAGGIERALGPAGQARLLRVPCAGSTATGPTGCFTALP
jgi:hypothetical protein